MKKLAVLILLFIVVNPITSQSNTIILDDTFVPLQYVSHSPFDVDEDSDFISYAFPGNGSLIDPYIIEDYIITTSNSYGIRISNVTKYFVIRNCMIENQLIGVHIQNVSSNRTNVQYNICKNNSDYGIRIENSGEVGVENNTCQNNGKSGIYIFNGTNSLIKSNICEYNGVHGIYVEDTALTMITKNDCYNNFHYGINIENCSSSEVVENSCNQNRVYGTKIFDSPSSIFLNNELNSNWRGAYFFRCDFNNISNNTCEDSSSSGFTITRCEQINFTKNLLANNDEDGLDAFFMDNSIVDNNTCIGNRKAGLSIRSALNSTISFNNLTNNGLEIEETLTESYSTYTLYNNTINNLPFGFLLHLRDGIITKEYGQMLLVNCSRTTIEGKSPISIKLSNSPQNTIINNNVKHSEIGINLINSDFCEILNNSISHQLFYGIYTEDSDHTLIANNTIGGFTYEGFYIRYSPNSEIINNTIQDCTICLIWGSDSSIFSQNTLTIDYGVGFEQSSDLIVENNYFYKGGFIFSEPSLDFLTYTWNNNLIDGLPSMILIDLNGITVTEKFAQILLINCINVIVKDQQFTNVPEGVAVRQSEHITIRNCLFTNGSGTAMYIMYSSYIDIRDNIVDNYFQGILIREMTPYINISHNTFMNNAAQGIVLSDDYCRITYNLFQNNSAHGISIYEGHSNILHHNNFIGNNHDHEWGTSQALDEGYSNQWYEASTHQGNFWDDWSGSGPYILDGGNVDPYPLSSEVPAIMPEYSANLLIACILSLFFVIFISRKHRKKQL